MTIPVLNGLSAVARDYDGFILDLWGVIHDGAKPYPGAPETLLALKQAGKKVVLLSNAPRRGYALTAAMEAMGIPRSSYDDVMSSGEAVHMELIRRRDPFFAGLGQRCHHIGPERDRSIFDGLDLQQVDVESADFLLNTGPWGLEDTVEDYMPVMRRGIARKLPMICANPDLVVIREGRRVICAGALAKAYEDMGGDVVWRGKPDPAIYDLCLEMLGIEDRSRILAVGDAFHTDIAGANASGIDSLLVTGGIHGEELGVTFGQMVEPVRLCEAAARHGQTPTGALPAFVW
ncbi:TIGR01459 family HAD-type hydrolase [Telmatospirillum sp. J64-1]|uniref:TIGR01459 family HAD-type hydrolase n=1 Tax=Telmatospirillum sp. J64-1 TaxID=2502183 RepID=UPI0021062337|nr:TIGR01459 family HAD-type hydrolase [Telmatospirillum sp. J64-1]